MHLKTSAIYLAGRLLPALVSFAAVIWYTHLVTPAQYGAYALVLLAANVANIGLFQWLRVAVLRLAPGESADLAVLRSTALAGFGGLVLLSFVPGTLIFLLAPEALRGLVAWIVPLTWGLAWSDLNLDWLRARLAPWRYSLLALSRSLLTLGLSLLFVYRGEAERGLLAGAVLGALLPGFLFMPALCGGVRWRHVDFALLRRMKTYGLPLAATYLLSGVVGGLDRFLLGALGGAALVGPYAAAADIARNALHTLMQAVNLGAFPLAVRALEQEGEEAARAQLRHNAVLLALVSLPAATGLFVAAPALVTTLLHGAFHAVALPVFGLVAVATLLNGWRVFYLDQSFQLGHKTGPQVWIMGLTLSTGFVLSLFLIPRLGSTGAALGNICTFAVAAGLSWHWGRRIFPLPGPDRDFVKIAASALFMGLALWPFRATAPLVLQVVAGGGLYVLGLLVFNVMGLRKSIRL